MKILALLLISVTAFAQTTPQKLMTNAYQLCVENTVITAMPVGTVYQFGAGTTFTTPATSTAASPKLPFTTNYKNFPFDPLPGQTKYFYVQQTAKVQVFTITGSNGQPQTITVPAASVVVTPPPITPPLISAGTYTCSVVIAADGTFTIDPKTCAVSK